jgi:hypothetical protein
MALSCQRTQFAQRYILPHEDGLILIALFCFGATTQDKPYKHAPTVFGRTTCQENAS